jgi:hypothetical protein
MRIFVVFIKEWVRDFNRFKKLKTSFGVSVTDILIITMHGQRYIERKQETLATFHLLGRRRQLGADALRLGLLLDELLLRDFHHRLDLIRPLEALGHLVLAVSTRAWVAKQEPLGSALEEVKQNVSEASTKAVVKIPSAHVTE